MTTINFPSSPSAGQIYTLGSRSWKWSSATYVCMAIKKAP